MRRFCLGMMTNIVVGMVLTGCTGINKGENLKIESGFNVDCVKKVISGVGISCDNPQKVVDGYVLLPVKKLGQFNIDDGASLILGHPLEADKKLFKTFSLMISMEENLTHEQLLYMANQLNRSYLGGRFYVIGQKIVYHSTLVWHENISVYDELTHFLKYEEKVGEDFLASMIKSVHEYEQNLSK
jgi:uncharacterized protein involved in tolerance to divalent cations